MVKTETPLSPLSVLTASRVPVSSAAPGWVKKNTTTSPRASALIAGSVLATSAVTGGLAGFAGVTGFVCVGTGVVVCDFSAAGFLAAGVALWVLAPCAAVAGLAAGFAALWTGPVCGCGVTVVTALFVSLAERVARKAAAQSATPSRAMSTGRGRVITPSYRHGPPCGLGLEQDFALCGTTHGVERRFDAGPAGEAERPLTHQDLHSIHDSRASALGPGGERRVRSVDQFDR